MFVQLNERAKQLWDKYVEIYSISDLKPWERKSEFCTIKSEFYEYVINVPLPWNRDTIIFDSEKETDFYISKYNNSSLNYQYSENEFTQNIGYIDVLSTTKFH